jgi:hypothetical protein
MTDSFKGILVGKLKAMKKRKQKMTIVLKEAKAKNKIKQILTLKFSNQFVFCNNINSNLFIRGPYDDEYNCVKLNQPSYLP